MRRPIFILFSIFLVGTGTALSAGTIVGSVQAEGKALPSGQEDGGAYASKKQKFIQKMNYDELRAFVVYVDQPVDHPVASPTEPLRVVVQANATFSPHILPVMVGTTVEWPNEDDIYHNVFSFSAAKPFDLGLYKEEVKQITFDQPGRVDVFCSIHKNMNCVVLVLENPYFANTNRKGQYRIENVPAGTYRLTAWHERMPPQTQEVTVPEEGEVALDFQLGIKGLPQY